jgi:hypothetical protein
MSHYYLGISSFSSLINLTKQGHSGLAFSSNLYSIGSTCSLATFNSRNSCAILAMTYWTCSLPNFCPRQVRIPWLKGMNSQRLGVHVSHRDGRNWSASGPTRSGRRWRDHNERTVLQLGAGEGKEGRVATTY